MRFIGVTVWLAGLCLGAGAASAADDVPLPRPRPKLPPAWVEPMSFREAAGPDLKPLEVTSAPSDCFKRLNAIAEIAPLPRLIGPGACGGSDMVEFSAVRLADNARVEIKPATVLRCAFAEQVAVWVRYDAGPRVAKIGEALRTVETYDDFSCRGRNRVFGAKLSEHGKGNAVDVRALVFASHRSAGLTDVAASKDLREGLRESACGRFTTVLGPGSDGYHEQHIHLDLAERRNGYRICQWAVREPPKPKPPEPATVAAAGTAPAPPEASDAAEPDGDAEEDQAKPRVLVPMPPPRPQIAHKPARSRKKL